MKIKPTKTKQNAMNKWNREGQKDKEKGEVMVEGGQRGNMHIRPHCTAEPLQLLLKQDPLTPNDEKQPVY